jgi:hypothetical protein
MAAGNNQDENNGEKQMASMCNGVINLYGLGCGNGLGRNTCTAF